MLHPALTYGPARWGFEVTIASNDGVAKNRLKRVSARLRKRQFYKPILNNMKAMLDKAPNRDRWLGFVQSQSPLYSEQLSLAEIIHAAAKI